MDKIGVMNNKLKKNLVYPIIVIDVVIKQPLWKWMRISIKHFCNLMLCQDEGNLIKQSKNS
jgi:hypothetical protein